MGILNNSNAISTGGEYTIDNSLRFRSSASAYLNRTPSSAGNRRTWTWSGWVKRGTLSTLQAMFDATSSGTHAYHLLRFYANDTLNLTLDNTGTVSTTGVFRDTSAWYHIVVVMDTTQSTSTDRVKMYVNGDLQTVTGVFPSLNEEGNINSDNQHSIGRYIYGNTQYYNGYIAELNLIDGQALTPSDFGEYNEDNGVWQPKKYTGTYGTNGFYLKGRGTDNSGNGNNWTENNFNTTTSTATTYDIMSDVPTLTDEDTSNYPVINELASTLFNTNSANLQSKRTSTSGMYSIPTSMAIPQGDKWYAEFTGINVVAGAGTGYQAVGICDINDFNPNVNTYLGTTRDSYGYFNLSYKSNNGTVTAGYGASWTTNDVIGVAVNLVDNEIEFFKNGASQGVAYTNLESDRSYCFALSQGYSTTSEMAFNAGQRPFSYTPPTGYKKLNTYNLPDSTIEDGSEYFNTVTYTGTGATRSVTGVGFQPDWVWIKNRAATYYHNLSDTVRGITRSLSSNATDAEVNFGNISAVGSDGFTVSGAELVNKNAQAIVAWNWKAGGSAVSNGDGSITSTVSANTTAGFSIATWSSPVSNGSTIGHGLSSTPELLILKSRASTSAWGIFAPTILGNKYLYFTSSAGNTNSSYTPGLSNTLMTVPYYTYYFGGPANSGTNLCYAFHSVEGYSKFGSYTGNGNADGTFVYTGFRPSFVMIKRTDSTANWYIYDTSRGTTNAVIPFLNANNTDAEQSFGAYDFLSNGFKNRQTNVYFNASGGSYVYMAFAENPFKNSTAR